MKFKLLIIDIGGCEGCALAALQSLPSIESRAEVYSPHLGNVGESERYDIALVSGPVCLNSEHSLKTLKMVRERSEVLVAFGSCAAFGGIARFCRGGQEPHPEHRLYQPLSSVVEVDYAIPGCPPAPQTVSTLVNSLARGTGPFLKVFASAARARKLSGFDLLDDVVLPGLCIGCGACTLSCPTNALQMIDRRPDIIAEKCIRCGTCYVRCPRASQILLKKYPVNPKIPRKTGV